MIINADVLGTRHHSLSHGKLEALVVVFMDGGMRNKLERLELESI